MHFSLSFLLAYLVLRPFLLVHVSYFLFPSNSLLLPLLPTAAYFLFPRCTFLNFPSLPFPMTVQPSSLIFSSVFAFLLFFFRFPIILLLFCSLYRFLSFVTLVTSIPSYLIFYTLSCHFFTLSPFFPISSNHPFSQSFFVSPSYLLPPYFLHYYLERSTYAIWASEQQ